MAQSFFKQSGQFFRGNLHTHSTNSDGKNLPEDVCQYYRDAGYNFLMLSDHYLEQFNFPISDTRAFRTEAFTTIIGAEIHAPKTQHGQIWHIIAAGLPLDFPQTDKNENAVDLARRAAKAGAFIGIAHPAWSGLSMEDVRSIDVAHAVEIYNYGSDIETSRGDGFYILDALCNEGRMLNGYATDDAHFHNADHGGAWMMVKAESLDPDLLVEAMKKGHYYSTQGPSIEDITVQDGEINITCSPVETAVLLGRGYLAEHIIGEDLSQITLPTHRFKNDWLRVVLTTSEGKRAWSNPFQI